MILPRADKKGGWTEELIKPYGRLVREFVRKYNEGIYK
jgi:endoglucanase